MASETFSENLHRVLGSIMEGAGKLKANHDALQLLLSDNCTTKSPRVTMCEQRVEFCDANCTLLRLRSDITKLEDLLVTLGKKVVDGKISDLYPSMENLDLTEKTNDTIECEACSSPHLQLDVSPGIEVRLEDEAKVDRRSRRRSRSLTFIVSFTEFYGVSSVFFLFGNQNQHGFLHFVSSVCFH
ncbi:unnamed protein product [Haemonchus placei]|uniref:Spindle and kinetochore-associated protein 3 n=1 Tax=Haemonchus placei TaxID=6290 RepID=A0A0N4W817_HAEPC|nr:unnamed protein product [Haemonchus placei]